MKILSSNLLFVILFSILDGRFVNTATASESEKTIVGDNQYKTTAQDELNEKESILTKSSNLEINSVFSKETERQEILLPSQLVVDDSAFLDKIEVSAELSTTAEAVVFPSVDTAAELKNKVKTHHEKVNSSNQIFSSVDNEKEEYVVHAEPKIQVQTITEETVVNKELNENESLSSSSQEEPKKTEPQHEDIPSFSEWTQKQLAEAEKKRTDQNETTDKFAKTRGKFRNKNYASPDCGAKIVAANPESLSSSSILSSLKDEYMLNYCTNRIWFVVELCEAIQAKQLDLANFELFSSSPKHFSVFVSHRFPTRDWSNVGKFTAQDSRDVQTFNLHPHLFGKYIKVEMHSHYGREQFCPISWVGVYGTSEFEVLAKEDERHLLQEDDDVDPYDEDIFVGNRPDSPKNLFSSATDAVLSIVKKATAPFMKTENNDTESENSGNVTVSGHVPCFTPRYITVCNNCSQTFYDEVFELLSCQHLNLFRLISSSFVRRTLINSESCSRVGLDFNSLKAGAPFPSNFLKNPKLNVNYLTVMLKESIVAALCNVLAVSENKVVINATVESVPALTNLTQNKDSCGEEASLSKSEVPDVNPSSDCRGDCSQPLRSQYDPYTKTSVFTEIFKPSPEQFSEKIEPTKTLTEDEVKKLPPSNFYSETTERIVQEKSTELPSNGHVSSTATLTPRGDRAEVEKKETKVSFLEKKEEGEKMIEAEDKSNNGTNQDSTLESIISDINAIEKVVNAPFSSVTPSVSNLPTESIFLRLANRIKNLEINMSLSSTYLEELSKRYRTQLELLSKTLNLTIQKVEEYSKSDEEKERNREKEMMSIRMQLANLTRDVSLLVKEKNSWRPRASSISQHIFFISIEILLFWVAFNYWKRPAEKQSASNKSEPVRKLTKKSKRRSSLEGVKGHETPRRKMRRPSDEALEIALSRNYNREGLKIDKKRKRRKKDSRSSINVIHLKRKKSEGEMPETQTEKSGISEAVSEEAPQSQVIPNNMLNAGELQLSNRFAPMASPMTPPGNGNSIAKAFQGLSSPIFMKTALAARNSRLKSALNIESSQELSASGKPEQEAGKTTSKDRKGSNSLKKYMKKFF